jgi:hypothetical protein
MSFFLRPDERDAVHHADYSALNGTMRTCLRVDGKSEIERLSKQVKLNLADSEQRATLVHALNVKVAFVFHFARAVSYVDVFEYLFGSGRSHGAHVLGVL